MRRFERDTLRGIGFRLVHAARKGDNYVRVGLEVGYSVLSSKKVNLKNEVYIHQCKSIENRLEKVEVREVRTNRRR